MVILKILSLREIERLAPTRSKPRPPKGQSLLQSLRSFAMTGMVLTGMTFAGPFKLQCDPPQVFSGEVFQCELLYYSELPVIHIEVSKFPEFHGCYKENIGLKQGPIATFPDPKTLRTAAKVGSYLVYNRADAKNIMAQPMEVFLPLLNKTFLSEGNLPQILPLPPLPRDISPESFSGAVGDLQRIVAASRIPFRPLERTTLKISILGKLNFYDFAEFPLPANFPMTDIQQKTNFQGNLNFGSKTFEISGIVTEENDFTLPELSFSFFNLKTKKYTTVTTGPLAFERLAPVTERTTEESPPDSSHSFLLWGIALTSLVSATVVLGMRLRRPHNKKIEATEEEKNPSSPHPPDISEGNIITIYDFILNGLREKNASFKNKTAIEILENVSLDATQKESFQKVHDYYLDQFSNKKTIPFPKDSIEKLLKTRSLG